MRAELGGRLDRLGGFESAPFVAVAVSGGPDSLALAILADRWARSRGGAICALSVDHRLRPESGAETPPARLLAGGPGDPARRSWSGKGPKPATGIQQAARAARYRLLAQWCREHGCLHLLTAHHREDQAETHLIRRAAHSGSDGLAGMSAVRELDCCRVLRPLLGISKARLIATLAAEGQPFITDPSNCDPAFARAPPARRCGGGRRARDLAAMLDMVGVLGRERAAAELVRDAPAGARGQRAPGRVRGARSRRAAGGAARKRANRRSRPSSPCSAAAAIRRGGSASPGCFACSHGAAAGGHTLGGCRFVAWRGRWLVLRELAAAAGPVRLSPGASLLWDRRFAVALPAAATAPDDSRLSRPRRDRGRRSVRGGAATGPGCRAWFSRFCRRCGTRKALPPFLISGTDATE